ncbi:MAG: rRNA adenine dimethyltransferase family protein [Rubrivivax sp.]|nr:rRNA adenine dimethyltransferase family protein [Rubrivivax sp.]
MSHQARKRFGQHFLTDLAVIDDIVDAIDPQPGQRLVEIGPGLGAMTRPLRQRAGELTVIEADVLKVDFAALAGAGAPLRVVGNLPYNISTPILFHLLQAAGHIADQHFMLQREVVDRMAAAPGNKDFGRLTVMLQWRYQIESVLEVPPEAFDPPPRVHSAVVRMRPLVQTQPVDAALLSELVMVAFSQRRKLLRHTLGRWLEGRGFGGSFDVQRRAEEVPVSEYLALVRQVSPAVT